MTDRVDYILFQPPAGLALFQVAMQSDVVGMGSSFLEAVTNLDQFGKMIKLVSFEFAPHVPDVLGDIELAMKGGIAPPLRAFLELNLPKTSGKKSEIILGVPDRAMGVGIKNAFPGVNPITPGMSPVTACLFRGIRTFYTSLLPTAAAEDMETISLACAQNYSQKKVKYSALRDDKHIIAAIATIDSVDKGLNTMCMRLREWYGAHFPELITIISDNVLYAKVVIAIGNKSSLGPDRLDELAQLLSEDAAIAQAIIDASRVSVGVDLTAEDIEQIVDLAAQIAHQAELRSEANKYLSDKLNLVAPNLQVILGTSLAARLISKGGSLSELAKKPASTLQILGAEKALFRALKTKGNTPKYGILYHSSYISKAKPKDKGRISRYLANKAAMAARIDAFSGDPNTHYGEALKKQIESRVEYYSTGVKQDKNQDVMEEVANVISRLKAGDDAENGDLADDAMDIDPADTDEESKETLRRKQEKEEKKKRKEAKRAKKEAKLAKAKAEDGTEQVKKPKKKKVEA